MSYVQMSHPGDVRGGRENVLIPSIKGVIPKRNAAESGLPAAARYLNSNPDLPVFFEGVHALPF